VKRFVALLMLMSGLLVAGGANAVVIVSIQQSGLDVVVTTSGSLNTAAMGFPTNPSSSVGGIWPDYGYIQTGAVGLTSGVGYNTLPNFTRSPTYALGYWGAGGNTAGTSVMGALFAVDFSAPYVLVPTGYQTGTSLEGTTTFTGVTLAGLGITNLGTFTLSFGSGANTDSVTVYVGVAPPAPSPSAVPTLSEWSQMLLGLLVMTLLGWHFHKQRSY
jgi:hypothetical protein